MKVSINITGLDEVKRQLGAMAKQADYAASRAINTVAFKIRTDINDGMASTFKGGATKWTLRAFEILRSDKTKLEAVVRLRPSGAGKALSFDETIAHLFNGGTRAFKKSERVLFTAGILPTGHIMVVPKTASWANPLDSFGNPKKSLIVQLISYFQAFGEQGYRANMKDRNKKKLAGRGGISGYATIFGVQYFISRGKGEFNGRMSHLPAGIWAKRGIHGSDTAPVFLFVRKDNYRRFIDLERIANDAVINTFNTEFSNELAKALASAK